MDNVELSSSRIGLTRSNSVAEVFYLNKCKGKESGRPEFYFYCVLFILYKKQTLDDFIKEKEKEKKKRKTQRSESDASKQQR